MSTHMKTYTGAWCVTCDKCGRSESESFSCLDYGHASRFHARLAREGWTFWVSRSLRTYCPRCAPSPGHKMDDRTAYYLKRGHR